MCFHPDRCNILSVTKSRRKYYHALHGQMLKAVNSTHCLGVNWPQMPPGRHINITNKTSRTLGSGKNPKDQLLFSKRQGLHGSCHTSPGICKLCLAPKQHQADQLPRVCTAKGSIVTPSKYQVTIPVSQKPIIPIPSYTQEGSCHSDYRKFSFFPTQSRIGMTSVRMWLLHPPLRLFVHVFQNQYLQSRPCPPPPSPWVVLMMAPPPPSQ